jgi:hypothetical protein
MNPHIQARLVGMNAREWISCARKRLILTPEEAQHRATQMQLKHAQTFTWYSCVYCGGYHVGRIGFKNERKNERKIENNRIRRMRNAFHLMQPYWVKLWREA